MSINFVLLKLHGMQKEYYKSIFENTNLCRYVLSNTMIANAQLHAPTYRFCVQNSDRLHETLLVLDTLLTLDFKATKPQKLRLRRIELSLAEGHPLQWIKQYALKNGQTNLRARFARNRHGIRRKRRRKQQNLFLYTQRNLLRHRVNNVFYEYAQEKYNFTENHLRIATHLNFETEVSSRTLTAYHTYLFTHFSGVAMYFSIR